MAKSKIYREIAKNEIEKIVINLYGSNSKLINFEVLKGGLFNTTYLLKTNQDDIGIVLRIAPVNKHLLFDFEKDSMGDLKI